MKRSLFLMTTIASCLLLVVGCSEKEEVKPREISSIKMTVSSVTLAVGETVQLGAVPDLDDVEMTLTWTSSNESVATVSGDGVVTAVATGSSQITAMYLGLSAKCVVSVSKKNSDGTFVAWDPSVALAAPLSESIIYSKNVLLYSHSRIMQSFDLASDGSIYYSQLASGATAVNVCRASGPNENADSDNMVLNYFGHGTQIAVEEADDGKTYVWLDSNGTYNGEEYVANVSFSRVEFAPGTSYDSYGGETFFLNKNDETSQHVSIDFVSRRMLVMTNKSGYHYWVFDYDEVMALPLKTMTANVTVGTESKSLRVEARDLNDCTVLGNFTIRAGSNYDTDVLSYSGQGAEIWGNYIYIFEGTPTELDDGNYQSKAYVTCLDYSGNIVIPRTEVVAIADLADLNTYGLTFTGYAEAEGIKIRDGKLYLGIGCTNGYGSNRTANILVYDCKPLE